MRKKVAKNIDYDRDTRLYENIVAAVAMFSGWIIGTTFYWSLI